MRMNRISKFNYANAGSDYAKTTMQDGNKLYHEEDLVNLPNPYSETLIEQITAKSTDPDSASFSLRDAAVTGSRPWVDGEGWKPKTTDLKLADTTVMHKITVDLSHSKETTIAAGEGPTLDHKHSNIGNSLLVVGRKDLGVSSCIISPSKTLVAANAGESIFVFVKLLDAENGLIQGTEVQVVPTVASGSISTTDASGITSEDGIAILPLTLETTSVGPGDPITLTVTSTDPGETWSFTSELIQTD